MLYITDTKQFNELRKALKNATVIGIDTEGTALSAHDNILLLVSLYTNDQRIVIDIPAVGMNVLQILKPYLEDPDIIKVGHNLVYDWQILYHNGKIEMIHMHDTLLADKLIHAGLFFEGGFGLKAVAERRLGIELDKSTRKEFLDWFPGYVFTDTQIEYSANDAVHVVKIMQLQMDDIKRLKLERIYSLEMAQIAIAGLAEYTGVNVNKQMLIDMIPAFDRFIAQADKALQDLLIDAGAINTILFEKDKYTAINTNSGDQMKEAFQALNISPTGKGNKVSLNAKDVIRWDFKNRKNKSKDWEVDYHTIIDDDDVADALDAFVGIENPYLRAHAYVIGARKLLSTYIHGLISAINEKTNRVHPKYSSMGAHRTGRYSSYGPNFQNMPNDLKLKRLGLGIESIRYAIQATKGRKLIIADYSGIELVILAVLSGDKKLMYEILQGDVHTYVGNALFPNANITKDNKKKEPAKSWRQGSKRVSYSVAYGTTGSNLSEQLNIDLATVGVKISAKEGDDLIEEWFKLFPETAAYLKNNAKMAITKGYVVDAWGRRRNWDLSTFENKWKRLAAGREGMNAPIQGSSATMTKRAMQLCHQRLNKKYARIIITVHDELVLESSDSYVDTAVRILKESMEQALAEVLPQVADLVGKVEALTVAPSISWRYDK